LTVGKGIAAALYPLERRHFKINSKTENAVYSTCGRAGPPEPKSIPLRDIQSKKCGCQCKFSVSKKGVSLNLIHNEKCRPDAEDAGSTETRPWLEKLDKDHPGVEELLVQYASELYDGDFSAQPRHIKRQLCAKLGKEYKITHPPENAIKSVIKRGIMRCLNNVPIKDSLQTYVRSSYSR